MLSVVVCVFVWGSDRVVVSAPQIKTTRKTLRSNWGDSTLLPCLQQQLLYPHYKQLD